MRIAPKIIVVVGPTASGKSEYAVKLAKKHNGEIISADSRQVYRGLDIGTGKVAGKWRRVSLILYPLSLTRKLSTTQREYVFVYKDIPHHCIDFVSPKRQYTVADFKRDGSKAIEDIISRGKLPIICGGTGQYVDALIFYQAIPEVPPNPKLRASLEKKTTSQLFTLLQKKDPTRAKSIDPHNPRRLIRALEIISATGKPIPQLRSAPALVPSGTYWHKGFPPSSRNSILSFRAKESATESRNLSYVKQIPRLEDSLGMTEKIRPINGHATTVEIHYLNPPREQLYKRIEKRFLEWLKEGLLKEIQKLHVAGVPWKRLEEFGLEYKYAGQYLRGKIDFDTMCIESIKSIKQYSKRQQTWFKKYQTNSKFV